MATIVRWNPLRELERMTADLGWPRVAPSAFSPSLDVLERDGKLHVRVDAPGVAKEDLHVEVNGGRLTISGERKSEETSEGDRFWHFERSFGSFRRTLTLPRGVDESSVEANYNDGVLEVVIDLPRKPEPTRVEIR
jgi:HSP20 family protein